MFLGLMSYLKSTKTETIDIYLVNGNKVVVGFKTLPLRSLFIHLETQYSNTPDNFIHLGETYTCTYRSVDIITNHAFIRTRVMTGGTFTIVNM